MMRRISRLLVAAACLAVLAACSTPKSRMSDAGTEMGADDCQPLYPADYCPKAPAEMQCWGDGDGCGPVLTDEQRAACGPTAPCPVKAPVPGVLWPAPIRDIEC